MRDELFKDLLLSAEQMLEIEKKDIAKQWELLREEQLKLLEAKAELDVARVDLVKTKPNADFANVIVHFIASESKTPKEVVIARLQRAGILDDDGSLSDSGIE